MISSLALGGLGRAGGLSTNADPESFAAVSLLLHFDGSDTSTTFTDSSSNGFTVTPTNNAQIDTAQSVYGGASGLFDGTEDYLTVAANDAFDFTSTDFTVEARIRLAAYAADNGGYYQVLVAGNWQGSTNANGWEFIVSGTVSAFNAILFNDGTTAHSFSHTFSLDTWYAIAVARSGSSLRAYVDGAQVGATATSTGACNASADLRIGRLDNATYKKELNGWLDELRVSKGTARYTGASYTVRGSAFPDSA